MDYDRIQFNIPDMFSIEWNNPLDDAEKKQEEWRSRFRALGERLIKTELKRNHLRVSLMYYTCISFSHFAIEITEEK